MYTSTRGIQLGKSSNPLNKHIIYSLYKGRSYVETKPGYGPPSQGPKQWIVRAKLGHGSKNFLLHISLARPKKNYSPATTLVTYSK